MRTWTSAVQRVYHPTDEDLSAGAPDGDPRYPVSLKAAAVV
jgi:hypothetical protein